MGAETTLRDTLNTADPNRFAAACQDLGLGDLLSLVIAGLPATETGIAVTAHVSTLANQPSQIFQVLGIAGTAGVKKIKKGPITGINAVVPNPGECVWDGGVKVLFNTADANTTATFTYALASQTDKASYLLRTLGEQDAK